MTTESRPELSSRGLMAVAGAIAAAPLLLGASQAVAQTASGTAARGRRLGTLEVSSVGIGVQDMSRTYQTTVPDVTPVAHPPATGILG